jgi:hypothetical protein
MKTDFSLGSLDSSTGNLAISIWYPPFGVIRLVCMSPPNLDETTPGFLAMILGLRSLVNSDLPMMIEVATQAA